MSSQISQRMEIKNEVCVRESPPHFRQGLCFILALNTRSAVSKAAGDSPVSSCHFLVGVLGLQTCALHIYFTHELWERNSNPHACTPSTLTH